MSKAKYSTEIKSVLEKILLKHEEVSAAVVFGLPCFKVNGKVFATLYDHEVGIKLPVERVNELLEQPYTKQFEPFGRNRGKQFVALIHENVDDFADDEALFLESAKYVASE